MKVGAVVVATLVGALLVSAVFTVGAQHQRRSLFLELQRLERERDTMQVEWGKLQLEASAWSTHDRIVGLARSRLGLHVPLTESIVLVAP